MSVAAAIVGLDARLALLNVGGAGRIDVMDGSKPNDVSVAITSQNVLGSPSLSANAFAGAIDANPNAQATANEIISAAAGNEGTATWFRAYDGNGLAIIDGTAGLVGASPELVLTDETFEVNDDVDIATWIIIQPE